MLVTILLVLSALLLFLESIAVKAPFVSLGWLGLALFVLVQVLVNAG